MDKNKKDNKKNKKRTILLATLIPLGVLALTAAIVVPVIGCKRKTTQYTITLTTNGNGDVSPASIKVDKDATWGSVKGNITVTPHDNYRFKCWQDKDGNVIADDYKITSDFTAKAIFELGDNVTLSQEVKDLGIGLTGFDVKKETESTITLSLPNGGIMSSVKLTIGDSVVSIPKDGGSITDGKITIPADKMNDVNIVVETAYLKGTATVDSSISGVTVAKGTSIIDGKDSSIVLDGIESGKFIDPDTLEIKVGDHTYTKADGITIEDNTVTIPSELMNGYTATITKLEVKDEALQDDDAFLNIYKQYLQTFQDEIFGTTDHPELAHTGKWYRCILPEGSVINGSNVTEAGLSKKTYVKYDIDETASPKTATGKLISNTEVEEEATPGNVVGITVDKFKTHFNKLKTTYNLTLSFSHTSNTVSYKGVDANGQVQIEETYNDHAYVTKIYSAITGSITKIDSITYIEQDVVTSDPYYLNTDGTCKVISSEYGKYVKDLVIPETYYTYDAEEPKTYKIIGFYSTVGKKLNDEDATFYNCYMETFKIAKPENITELNSNLFDSCANLKSFTIPSGVTELPGTINASNEPMISNCDALKSVIFENTENWTITDSSPIVTVSLDDYAKNATNLKNTTEGSTDNWGYTGLSNLIVEGDFAITKDGYVEIYGSEAKSKETLIIPEKVGGITVRGIQSNGCNGCAAKSISFEKPDNIIELKARSFISCDNLTSITIPKNVKHIGHYCFYDCDQLTNVEFENKTAWYQTNTEIFEEGDYLDVAASTSNNATYLKNCTAEGNNNWGWTGLTVDQHSINYTDITFDNTGSPTNWKIEKWGETSGLTITEGFPEVGFTFNGTNASVDAIGHFEIYNHDNELIGKSETKMYTAGTTTWNELVTITNWTNIKYRGEEPTVKFVQE